MTETTARSWQSRAKGLAWRVRSATRDTWHLVVLHPDGHLECTCEWWQNGGGALKDCKHAAAVRADAPGLAKPYAVWTEEDGYPAAWEWVALLDVLRRPAWMTEGA